MSEGAKLDKTAAKALGRSAIRAGAAVMVDASPEAVWEALIDVESWGDWYRGVTDVRGTSPLEESSEFRFKAGPASIDARVERLDDRRELRFSGSSTGVRSVYLFVLEPDSERVRVNSTQTMSGLGAMAMKLLLQGVAEKAVVRWLDALKEHVED